ncbi:MAG: 2-hydroxychromene-2-carboxylate isomerase [Hydrogenophaga sp.]|uniref:2-hydroxychromene-2-carboxylate isomerase n=1 Tax=Hydrogenophaga sp. TaxID=1904254 RepID=UPI0027171D9D|nr:2-hydroxychromene-2-carboxylate isomerase [Hydrogenophaga sp.]MDO9031955.1 2-hydroxychromene-2-carboxylate isomerase [Hydrogenophaga sp.]MDP2024105.1 2-hydroxychromene-2-carboxylate isomerase [Hydrogenophaga sp.]
MRRTVDYYFAPQSPWMYLGHERFAELLQRTGTQVRVLPVDFGKVFPVSGGLPLPQRAPQRQAYRLVELRRFSEALGIPLNPQPRCFPVAGDPAGWLITAVAEQDGEAAAMRLTGAVGRAVWAQERDIADAAVLADLLDECGLDPQRLAQSRQDGAKALYAAHTAQAIDAGVFGAPSYVIDGEVFWGQDRLDFVERRLSV